MWSLKNEYVVTHILDMWPWRRFFRHLLSASSCESWVLFPCVGGPRTRSTCQESFRSAPRLDEWQCWVTKTRSEEGDDLTANGIREEEAVQTFLSQFLIDFVYQSPLSKKEKAPKSSFATNNALIIFLISHFVVIILKAFVCFYPTPSVWTMNQKNGFQFRLGCRIKLWDLTRFNKLHNVLHYLLSF